jgi:hypothetical protein
VKHNPGWRYILWDEQKLANVKMINKDLFNKEDKYDCKSDISRLEILNKFGGYYIDSDVEWLGSKSLCSVEQLGSSGIVIAYEKYGSRIGNRYLEADDTRCANTVLGSTVQNPIIAYLIGQLRKSYETNRLHGVVASTGPDFVQQCLDSISKDINISILDPKYFYPRWWCPDSKCNPDYYEFIKCLSMSKKEMNQNYPDAIVFHKGFTSAKEGIKP